MMRRKRQGNPKAILLGLEPEEAFIWMIYSETIKTSKAIKKNLESKNDYNFQQEIIKRLKHLLKDGFNILIISSVDHKMVLKFIDYLYRSRREIIDKMSVHKLNMSITKEVEVKKLIKNYKLIEKINKGMEEISDKYIDLLNKAIHSKIIKYTVIEVIELLKKNKNPEIILITESYNEKNKLNRNYQSSIQLSKNRNSFVIIIPDSSKVGIKINQLGGFVCIV